MRSLLTLISLIAPAVLGAVHVKRYDGDKVPGRYIVKLKESTGPSIASAVDIPDGASHFNGVFPGFAAALSNDELEALRHNPSVAEIFEDGIAHAQAFVTQNDAPYGLERISHSRKIVQHANALSYNYTRDDSEGQGVDVYIVDTGINVGHNQFEGRARLGAAFGYADANDDNGHGTHCAGTVGSKQFGVAKKVQLIAVKVLDSDGNGAWSDIISGLDWVIATAASSGRPSVVNLSVGGGRYPPADMAVQSVANAGIHIAVAAGNSNIPVSQSSPGTAPGALTVGAVDINDAKAAFSNFGPEIDIHAPGVGVISTYIGSNDATASLSGTSMAAPHIAGLVAYFIALEGNASPAEMANRIKSKAIKGALTGLPADTVNDLAFNGAEALMRRGHVTRKDLLSFGQSKSRRDRFSKKRAVA